MSASPAPSARVWSYAHMIGILEGERLSFGDRGQEFPSPRLQQSLDGTSRNAHLIGGLLLLLTLEIAQAHGLELVEPEFNDLHLRQRDP